MSEIAKPSEGVTVTLQFKGLDGQPINPFGSRILIGDLRADMKRQAMRIRAEKRRERIYRTFLVVAVIIRYYVKKAILNTD